MSCLPVAILAGGLATRLRPLTEHVPKVLLEVAGKPFVMHQLELLQRSGVQRVVFCVGYLGEQVRDALGDGQSWGMDFQYVFDGPQLLGTGGALRKALPFLGESFLILYGDSYLEVDYSAVAKAFLDSGKMGLMTVLRNADQWDRSNVLFADGHIVGYDKVHRLPEMQHIDYGLGALRAQVFDSCPVDCPIDLATIYQGLLSKDQLAGFEATQRFYEIGSPAGLEETRRYLVMKCSTPVVFLDRDGVINRVVMRDGSPCSPRTIEEFQWEDGVKEAVDKLRQLGLTVIVVTNQPDIARGKMARSELDAMTERIYSSLRVHSVCICPHDDADGCRCRKPQPGMLLDAAKIWGIDCQGSFIIGDSWKDMEAGRAAGCRTILLDRPYNREASCEHRVRGLEQAVKLIIGLCKG
jgi:N-acetyl-alpha-D-muramate 1-phosphate uridylyltransferase